MRLCRFIVIFKMDGATLFVSFETKDFDRWQAVFGCWADRSAVSRVAVYRDIEAPNRVVAMIDWDDADTARAHVDDVQLKARMLEAGVVGVPEFHLVRRVEAGDTG